MPWDDGKPILYTWNDTSTNHITFYPGNYTNYHFLPPETERLLARFRKNDEGINECLTRILPILIELSDKLEGYRTGGIPL